jgi:oligopeptide transport system permease protein
MFWVKRTAALIPVLLLVSMVSFGLVRLAPGGPFDRDRAPASPEIERALRTRYHLDDPIWRQYLRFLGGLIRGDLGPSLKHRNHTVAEIIAHGLPVSAVIGGLAFLFAIGTGVALGAAGAINRVPWVEGASSVLALVAVCVPAFVVGPLVILVFAVRWEVFPVALWGGPVHWVLPVVTLGAYYCGRVARLVREGLNEVLRSEFIRTARAKGASEFAVFFRHALPVAILPVVAFAGPLLTDLLTGSFVVENLFQLPGLGTLTVNGALNRDYPLIVGLVLLYAALLLVFNLVADLLHAWLDPRVRHR